MTQAELSGILIKMGKPSRMVIELSRLSFEREFRPLPDEQVPGSTTIISDAPSIMPLNSILINGCLIEFIIKEEKLTVL